MFECTTSFDIHEILNVNIAGFKYEKNITHTIIYTSQLWADGAV